MVDLRLWRIALLAVPLAVAVAMFSLQEVPSPKEPRIAPDAYEGGEATELTEQLARSAAEPRPGSEADERLAEFVHARFSAIGAVQGAEQRFEVDGEELRNLIAILPGRSERQVALLAGRDVGAGTGAATSIASTAVMLEIAGGFSGATHGKTLVFVSTDGASLGAAGARRFVENYSDADRLDAVVVLSQPASPEPTPPHLIPFSSGPQSAGIELVETANATISKETGQPAGNESPLRELFRLALPAGLGEQAPLIEEGVDAVRISSTGELPPDPSLDDAELAPGSIERFGRATLALMLALDAAPGPLEHGPAAYVGLAGNLLPGWALGLIGLSLLAPVAATAAAGLGGSARSPAEAARSFTWVALRSLPFVAALIALQLLAWVGLIADPYFPFDPRLQSLDTGGKIGVLLLLAILGGGFYLLRPLRPPRSRTGAAAGPAALLLAVLCVFAVWLLNPYLALLLALGLNAWVLAATPAVRGRLASAGLVLAGALPLLAAVWNLADRLEAGPEVLWQLLFMIAGGQISFGLALLGCALAGCATALVAMAGPVPSPPAPEIRISGTPPPDDRGRGDDGGPRAVPPAEGAPKRDAEPDPSVYW